jgi:hypothetical protein
VAHAQNIFYYAVFYPAVEVIGALAIALILWYGGGGILTGAVTFGVVVAFIQYAERFYQPVRDLSEKFNMIQSAMVASERIFELLDTHPRSPSRPRREPSTASRAGRVRPGLVRLREGGLGPARRLVPGRAGREGGDRGRHRRGQDHHLEPPVSVSTSSRRVRSGGRHRHSRSRGPLAAAADRPGAAGRLPVLGHGA